MHADEAVQACIFADLLEHGKYRYDPAHYHGPLPHFINLPLMRALGVHELGALQPWQFRLQPALAGLLLVVLAGFCAQNHSPSPYPSRSRSRSRSPFSFSRKTEAGRQPSSPPSASLPASAASPASAFWPAALLAACSPLLVYFSRMAIHETLLACLALAVPLAAARFLKTRRAGWLLAAGVALGGLHATKETWGIIAFGWAVAAVALGPRKAWRLLRETGATRLALAAGAALAVSFLLHSNFGRHPRGFADAWLALFQYRTGGGHDKPWSYYLADILTFRAAGRGWYGEGAVLIFAALGAAGLMTRRRHLRRATGNAAQGRALGAAKTAGSRFGGPASPSGGGEAPSIPHSALRIPHPGLACLLALSSVVQLAVYSIIGYKTPWLMLVPVAGLVPLAGCGLAWLAGRRPGGGPWRAGGVAAGLLVLLFGVAPQLREVPRARATDPALPVVYAPTLPEADAALRRAVATLKPGQLAAVIGGDYWPVPWYFRARRDDTGYYEEFEAPGDLSPFALVIRCGYAPPPATHPGDVLVELRPGYYARISRD
jgi:hypothetical protein